MARLAPVRTRWRSVSHATCSLQPRMGTDTRSVDAIIEYLDSSIATTHLRIGAEVAALTDQQILNLFNDSIVATERLAASYRHVAVEIPPGRPQLRYFDRGDQWVPRGDVLRCIVHDGGPNNQAIIEIDDRDFSIEEFGRMLTTFAGWGMRVCFVPDDEIEKQPEITIREPDDQENGLTSA